MNIICKQQYVREDNEKNMLKNKMTIEHMNLHYGDFHALKDINLNIKENSDYSVYRTFQDVVNPPC